ncbi:MAG: thioether cross-link-forming SCIFF peptide maturase [Clostridia bacterium]
MIHAFSFNHNNSESYFIWDIESGSLHTVDKAAFLVCKKKLETLTEVEAFELAKIPETDVLEIENEFLELESLGTLNAPEKRYTLKNTGEIKALCLHICHDCNLKCSYCFAKEGTYNTERDYMSFDVGKHALDFLFSHSGERHNLEVDFFGGEPLMNFEVVKQLVSYAKQTAEKLGKHISFTMTTNGVLLNDEAIAYLNAEMDNVVISIDGRKEIHDKLRLTRNDKGSYDIAMKNALKFRAVRGDKRYYIRGTFTANNVDFSNDALHLNDCGFDQISLEPVVLPDSSPLALTREHLPEILKQYDILAEEYIARRKGDKWFNFFHFMIDLENGPCAIKRLNGCGAGKEYLAVTPVGEIYPCHQFVGSKYVMGNVMSGEFNREIQHVFENINVYKKEDCSKCIAKYYCSGGCLANSYNFNGDLLKPYKLSCEMMRKRLENSLAIYALEKLGL